MKFLSRITLGSKICLLSIINTIKTSILIEKSEYFGACLQLIKIFFLENIYYTELYYSLIKYGEWISPKGIN